MDKTNIEVKEQLLKDLAANIGYELIPEPFTTPFEEDSLKTMPSIKQFIWPVPTSVLTDEAHKDFRKMWVDADLIDTVAELSWEWPSNEDDRMAILLIDFTRRRRGSVKFVDASRWDIPDETDMAAVCNMLIHDLFPGEDLLAFKMNEDAMDEGLDDRWNEQVHLVSGCEMGDSLLPQDYLPRPIAKPGFRYVRLDSIFSIEDLDGASISEFLFGEFANLDSIREFELHDNVLELKVPAIVVSAIGNFHPQKVLPGTTSANVDLNEKIVLIPHSYIQNLDLDYLMEQLEKESTIRQLPFLPYPNARLEVDHIKGVKIEIPQS